MEPSPALHDYAERRVNDAVARIASPLDRIAICLSDDNGPRGGVDKRCRILVRGAHRTVAEAVDADPYAAVDRACARLAETLRRVVERGRRFLRVRLGEAPPRSRRRRSEARRDAPLKRVGSDTPD